MLNYRKQPYVMATSPQTSTSTPAALPTVVPPLPTSTSTATALKFARNMAIGGVAAALSKTANSPLEVAKLNIQTQPQRFKSLSDVLVKLPREKGVSALWAGNGTNVLRYFPTQALNFAVKERYQDMFMPKGKDGYTLADASWRYMLAGGCAGSTVLTFVHPLDVARTKLSTDVASATNGGAKTYQGLRHCLQVTYAQGGVRSLWAGYSLSVFSLFPYRAMYFGGFESCKAAYSSFTNDKPGIAAKWAMSQSCTVLGATMVYPADTVRRTLMKAGEVKHGITTPTYRSSWHCFRSLLAERGWSGMYSGVMANNLRTMGAALCMVLFDEVKERLEKAEREDMS